jgi:hypothetical protein
MHEKEIYIDNGLVPHCNLRRSQLCAAVRKRGAGKRDQSVLLRELQRHPDTCKGRWIMLTGAIIKARNTKNGTFIEMLQRPMDSRGRPYDTDVTEGRFIIATDRFLDGAVYPRGRRSPSVRRSRAGKYCHSARWSTSIRLSLPKGTSPGGAFIRPTVPFRHRRVKGILSRSTVVAYPHTLQKKGSRGLRS